LQSALRHLSPARAFQIQKAQFIAMMYWAFFMSDREARLSYEIGAYAAQGSFSEAGTHRSFQADSGD
jgi:hypothetical protein